MAREGITFEQVAQVADALVGAGQQPTIRAVREKLGDTGSPNTIHKLLAKWRDARPVAIASAPELPQALLTALATEIQRATSQARAEVQAALVAEQADSKRLAEDGERKDIELAELQEQIAALTTERDTLAGKTAQQAADLADAQQRIEREQQAAEAARVELAKAQLKIDAQAETLTHQAAEVERLRADMASEVKGRVAAEQQAAVLTAKLESMTERTGKAETRVDTLEKQLHQVSQELNQARVQAQAQQGALDAAGRELEAAKADAAAARAEAKKSAADASELRGKVATLEGKGKKAGE